MVTGILINARLGSSRLPQKHMLDVAGKPILTYLLRRINYEFHAEIKNSSIKVVINTTEEPENAKFEIFKSMGIEVFYGSVNNIPLRQLQAINYHSFNNIVSIDGDCILSSVWGMRSIYNELTSGSVFVKTTGLPFGMNSMGYEKGFLEESLTGNEGQVLETGWGRIFDDSRLYEIGSNFSNDFSMMRFTLDYEKDYLFFKSIIERLGEKIDVTSDEAIIQLVRKYKLFEINSDLSAEYWENFHREMSNEAD